MPSFAQFVKTANNAPRGSSALYVYGKERVSVFPEKHSDRPQAHVLSWKHFLETANKQFGEKRVRRIFQRYAIDPQALIRQGAPLQAKHVLMLALRETLLQKKDLKQIFGNKADASTLRQFLSEHTPSKPLNVDPSKLMGGPTTWKSFFLHDPYLMDRELERLFSDVNELSQKAYLERLCKSILPRELPKGLIVPAPHPKNSGHVDFYEIYEVVTVGDGLVAYAFKPLYPNSELQPMILFRSSPFCFSAWDVLETWMNNLQKDIGWLGYHTARGKLAEVTYNPLFCPKNKRILVGGFSLGGVHAQLFIADHIERVSKAIFFNDPSIDAETADLFAAKVNAADIPQRIKVRMYRTLGDMANFVGEKHVFCGVKHPQVDVQLTIVKPNVPISPKQSHGWKFLDAHGEKRYSKHNYTDHGELSRELDNSQRGNEVLRYEEWRLIGSYLIYPWLFIWTRFLHCLENFTGIRIARRSVLKYRA